MKPILFLTAYSSHAPVIWQYVQQIAAELFDNRIVAAHIYEGVTPSLMTNTMDPDMGENIQDYAERQQEEQKDRLRDFLRSHRLNQDLDLQLNYIIRPGDAMTEIQDIVTARDYGLVVMGTQTRGGIEELILGSVAKTVVESANCPVFFVPPKATYQPIRDLLFASSFSPRDQQIIDYLLDWTTAFQTKLHLLHISQDQLDWEESNQLIEQWKRYYNDYLAEKVIEYVVGAGPVITGILSYAKKNNCGFIALHKRERSLMERWLYPSHTKVIQQQSDRPLLIFNPKFKFIDPRMD